MAQFDLYHNNIGNKDIFPYLLDITNDIHTISKFRVVVPLCNDNNAINHLNPIFDINGEQLYMSTMDISGIPITMLDDVVINLEKYRTQIVDALDFLINGF